MSKTAPFFTSSNIKCLISEADEKAALAVAEVSAVSAVLAVLKVSAVSAVKLCKILEKGEVLKVYFVCATAVQLRLFISADLLN